MYTLPDIDRRLQLAARSLMAVKAQLDILRKQVAASYQERNAEIDRVGAMIMQIEVDIAQIAADCQGLNNDDDEREFAN